MNPDLKSTHKRYKQFTESEEMRDLYEARVKYQRDVAHLIHSGHEKGLKEGIKQGKIVEKQETLIMQLNNKFEITPGIKNLVLAEKNPDILDDALHEILFAKTLDEMMSIFRK